VQSDLGAIWEIPGKWQPHLLVDPVHGTDMYRINKLAQWFFIPVPPQDPIVPPAASMFILTSEREVRHGEREI
jgi:hypothetical protein